jgi:hypothetical protein
MAAQTLERDAMARFEQAAGHRYPPGVGASPAMEDHDGRRLGATDVPHD